MKNIEFFATDNIELVAQTIEVYKQAREKGYYIVDRQRSGNFAIAWKDMMMSYDHNAIGFERFFPPENVFVDERDMYEFSEETKAILKEIEDLEEVLKNNGSKKMSEDEKESYINTLAEKAAQLENAEPIIVKKQIPLYKNSITGSEWALIKLSDLSDQDIEKMVSANADFVLHTKYFMYHAPQKQPLRIVFFKSGEWHDMIAV